jgi:DNA-binding NtrC family response regulator
MTAERRKILTMLAEQKLSVADAEGLLDILERTPERPTLEIEYITQHPPLQKTLDDARKAASSNLPILIVGESGTGKELVARMIHQKSPRRDKPFIPINCTALPDALGESELFGHERGAFTGAIQRKIGVIERADGGTILLDELSELPSALQTKLVQFMTTRRFERVGGTEKIRADVRVIAATNLTAAELAGRIRENLFSQLSTITLELTPLREAKEDIPLLVGHFLKKAAAEHNRPIPTVTPEAMDALHAHDWPGNVRELARAIERAVVMCDDGKIEVGALPAAIVEAAQRSSEG